MKNFQLVRKLIRAEQWYKNLIIFIPLLFATNAQPWYLLLLGFLGLCAISSITYISNDWIDRERDSLHPTKKNRPLASGKVTGPQAMAVTGVLMLLVIFCITQLGSFYGSLIATYFFLTSAYSLGLKNIPILDILIICANFTLRMMAGLDSPPEPYQLSYFGFLFALTLMLLTHKRRSDIKLLGSARAAQHKAVLHYYTPRVCHGLRTLAYGLLILSFYQLFEEGWPIIELILLMGLLIYTSVLFTKDPALVIKPHYLLKNKIWDLLLLASLVGPFLK